MTTLEGHYRRLLGVYPLAHRRAYEQEMLGVLMDGSRPGQRFPAVRDALDVLSAGLRARIGHSGRGLRADRWRDAAAIAGPLVAVLLLAVAGRRLFFGLRVMVNYEDPMTAYGVDGLLLLDVGLRTLAWLAVVIAIVAGLRRTAAWLSVVAVVVELAVLIAWLPLNSERPLQSLAWAPVLMVLCVAGLFASVGRRPVGQLLGRRGILLAGAGLAVAIIGMLPARSAFLPSFDGVGGSPWPVALTAVTLLAAGIWQAPGEVRRRAGLLLGTALAVPVAHLAVLAYGPIRGDQVLAQFLVLAAVLTVVPAICLALGLLIVERHEEARG
jgi:hypothetical protein